MVKFLSIILLLSFVFLSGCEPGNASNSFTQNKNTENKINTKDAKLNKEDNNLEENDTTNSEPMWAQAKSDDLQLGNLRLNITFEEIKKEINSDLISKEKSDIENQFDSKINEVAKFEDGTEIFLVNNIVKKVSVSSDKYPTPRGFKVGDSRENLMKLYGTVFGQNNEFMMSVPNTRQSINFCKEDNKDTIILIFIDDIGDESE